ncbi:MAG: hypothetical protein ABJO27_15555 [Pseudoruegeria sp.]
MTSRAFLVGKNSIRIKLAFYLKFAAVGMQLACLFALLDSVGVKAEPRGSNVELEMCRVGGLLEHDLDCVSPKTSNFEPLVLDLDGNGIDLINFDNSFTYFDLDSDGYAENIAWIEDSDGVLATDKNRNGVVDNGNELIMVLGTSSNPWKQLEEFDDNKDSILNQKDTSFDRLLVWRDLNENGEGEEGELFSMNSLRIHQISFQPQTKISVVEENLVRIAGSYHTENNENSAIYAVRFMGDINNSQSLFPDGFDYHRDAYYLPVLWSIGRLTSTAVSVSSDPRLRDKALELVAISSTGNIKIFRNQFKQFLFDWANVSSTNVGQAEKLDATLQVDFLEALYGGGDPVFTTLTSNPDNRHVFQELYELQVDKLAGRFLAQSAGAYAYVNSNTLEEHNIYFRRHPFRALQQLTEFNSPTIRELDGEWQDVVNQFVLDTKNAGIEDINTFLALSLISNDYPDGPYLFEKLVSDAFTK